MSARRNRWRKQAAHFGEEYRLRQVIRPMKGMTRAARAFTKRVLTMAMVMEEIGRALNRWRTRHDGSQSRLGEVRLPVATLPSLDYAGRELAVSATFDFPMPDKHEWRAANNGSGARIWFVTRTGPDGEIEVVETSDGRTVRFASYEAAQARADKLNRESVAVGAQA